MKRAVFTGSEPMQNPVKNPVNFYPVKKPVKDPVKNLLKTCELSQCFSQGVFLSQGISHIFHSIFAGFHPIVKGLIYIYKKNAVILCQSIVLNFPKRILSLSPPPPTPQGITCMCSTCVIVTGNCLTYMENKTNDK